MMKRTISPYYFGIALCLIVASAGTVSAAGEAFPYGEAGFCSWIQVAQPIDLDKAVSAYTQIDDLSATHAMGNIPTGNWRVTENIEVYVDTDGYIVAFFDETAPSSKAIKWAGQNWNAPLVGFITSDAIQAMCTALAVSCDPGTIHHYNFNHPTATTMVIFENTMPSSGSTQTEYTTILIPSSLSIKEASYSLANYDGDYSTTIYSDGASIGSTNSVAYGRYDVNMHLTQDVSHTLQLTIPAGIYGNNYGGVATVLVYSQ